MFKRRYRDQFLVLFFHWSQSLSDVLYDVFGFHMLLCFALKLSAICLKGKEKKDRLQGAV